MSLLADYYTGGEVSFAAAAEGEQNNVAHDDDLGELAQRVKPRKNLPPLLCKLDERPAECLHWLGTSYVCCCGGGAPCAPQPLTGSPTHPRAALASPPICTDSGAASQ